MKIKWEFVFRWLWFLLLLAMIYLIVSDRIRVP